jgi:uncharacterized protein YjgD (DUF1641 family)
MEAPEHSNIAENCANYFRNPPVTASVHFCADDNSVVQTALLTNTVAGAAGANRNGIHIEQGGYAKQSGEEWSDSYSSRMIEGQVGPLVKKLCEMYNIPYLLLNADDLRAGYKGIASHDSCSKAFGGDHWDPGPNYPWIKLFDALQGEDMPITEDEMKKIADLSAKRVVQYLVNPNENPGVIVSKNVHDAVADIQVKVTDTKNYAVVILEAINNLQISGDVSVNTTLSDEDIHKIIVGVAQLLKTGTDNI